MIDVTIHYFALLGDERGCRSESVRTAAQTPRELYEELRTRHGFRLPRNIVKVAVNDEIAAWELPLKNGDVVAYLPPFSGG